MTARSNGTASMLHVPVAVLAAAAVTHLASAQNDPTPGDMTKRPALAAAPSYKSEVLLFGQHQGDKRIDEGGGRMELSRFFAGYFLTGDADRGNPWSLGLRYRYDHYSFSESTPSTRLGPTEPWDDINTLGGGFEFRGSEDLQLWGGAVLEYSAESGVSLDSDSLTYGGFFGASFSNGDDFRIGGGLGLISEIDDTRLYPIFDLEWWVGNGVSFTTRSTIFAYANLEVVFNWELNDEWATGVSIAWQQHRFRLDGPAASGEDETVPVLWHLTYSPDEMFDVFLRVGFNWQNTLENDTATIGKRDADVGSGAVLLSLGVGLEF